MPKFLSKKYVLVTRPEAQAGRLCELIKKKGGVAIRFPVVEIKALVESEMLKEKFKAITQYDFVIFVSQNAVSIAFDRYLVNFADPCRTQFVAIGESTARSLYQYGIECVIHPGNNSSSESLLLRPELQSKQVGKKKILIVCGEKGRTFLADTLLERGAEVDCVELYQRCLPLYGMNDRRMIWQNKKPDAIIMTSNESLKNMVTLTLPEYRSKMFRTPLVVMSERVSASARRTGFVSMIKLAKKKSDEGLLSALIELIGD